MSQVLDAARRLFGKQLNNDSNEALFRCNSCGRPKLYVNSTKGAFYCVRCEHRGNVLRLQRGTLELPPEKDIIRRVVPPTLNDIRAEPVYSKGLRKYLTDRGFTDQQLFDLQVRQSSYVGEVALSVVDETDQQVDVVRKWVNLTGSVIFPIYDNGYRGYQARYIHATDKNKRWMSAPGVSRKTLLFNADRAFSDKQDTVFVAEGIPAACAFGVHGVATFGKNYSQAQLERLCGAPQKTIYIAYDGDAQYEAHQLGITLSETGKRVLVVPLYGTEDPDSISDLEARIAQAAPPQAHFVGDRQAIFHKQYRQPPRHTTYRPSYAPAARSFRRFPA